MNAAESEERWAAVRALREGEPPMFPLLSLATGLNIGTIWGRASREGWAKQDFHLKKARAGHRRRTLLRLVEDAPLDEASADGEGEGLREEPEARIAGMLERQMERMLAAAEAQGKILDKAQIDTMSSIVRFVGQRKALAPERAEDKNAGDDAELGELLRRMDDRILEVAIAVGRRMVAEGDRRILD